MEQFRAGRPDHLARAQILVVRQIVHHENIAAPQLGNLRLVASVSKAIRSIGPAGTMGAAIRPVFCAARIERLDCAVDFACKGSYARPTPNAPCTLTKTRMPPRSVPRVLFRRLLARRLDGADWVFVETSLDGEELAARLEEAGLDGARLWETVARAWRDADYHEFSVIGPTRMLKPDDSAPWRELMFPYGWAFDCRSGRWLPPDEPLTLDRPLAPRVEAFRVTFAWEDTGWMGVEIVADDHGAAFAWSSVWDPFPPLVDWLEHLIDGSPRASFDLEGVALELHVWPQSDGLVRLLMTREERDADKVVDLLDVVVARRSVIEAFYGPVLQRWRETPISCGWMRNERPRDASKPRVEEGMYAFYPVRSAKLEAYLGLCGD
ncbi:MAG: hypothetical protein JNK46_19855 [Methylobacteriaceae bacterium]|nr:hypothetical protein [Methylobacteriaceae bacterium]